MKTWHFATLAAQTARGPHASLSRTPKGVCPGFQRRSISSSTLITSLHRSRSSVQKFPHVPVPYAAAIALLQSNVPSPLRYGTSPLSQYKLATTRRGLWSGRNLGSGADAGPSPVEEDAARTAILEKALKSRQPTDLLLRCEFFYPKDTLPECATPRLGTILDSNGEDPK